MNNLVQIELVPLGARFEMPRGAALADILAAHGVEFPCGGAELCGGCRIRVLEGGLPARLEDRCVFSDEELAQGWRLACRARADGPLKLEVGQWAAPILADDTPMKGAGRTGLGIAVDVGTTTIAAQLLDLASGDILGVQTALNPQGAHGADVMRRVLYALSSSELTSLIRRAVGEMVAELAGRRAAGICEVVLVGNTVMHHLFSGLAVEPLSHAPFAPEHTGEQEFNPKELEWPLPDSCRIRFLPCIGGFVGSDVLAGIIATGLARASRLSAVIDLGTNGEIAIGNRDGILCASTAAGPAFEAASIRMGMRAAAGAVAHVYVRDGALDCRVIGDDEARGICGSGLVDAVAAGLDLGAILPSGRLANGARELPLCGRVSITQNDVRELQLAKAAVAAGMRLLLRRLGATPDTVEVVHLAGAFGNYVRTASAVRTGLLEVAPCKIFSAGNTALRGAKIVLLSPDSVFPERIRHVPLALEPDFQDMFIQCLNFPESPEP